LFVTVFKQSKTGNDHQFSYIPKLLKTPFHKFKNLFF